jgi:hypothetical protein
MQFDVNLTKKILITILIMLVLIAIVYYFNIPNPNMILIAGLVLCSAIFEDAMQEPDIEERFIRAQAAADSIKGNPQKKCGFYEFDKK